VIRVQPAYDSADPFARLFHKAVRSQWSAEDVDWEAPLGLQPRQAVALTRILSPVYLGEQSAMYGASAVIPQLAAAGETSAQLYLATFLLDEARHFEVLTQLYQRLGHHPVALRELPEMLRYHHRLRQGDRIDWMWGILISDLFARQFYQAFAKVQPAALFGRMSARVLVDESRHQAFSHTYLKRVVPHLAPERRRALRVMQSDILRIMESIHRRLRDDTEALGFDGATFLGELTAQIEAHARSIGLAAEGDGAGGPGGGAGTGPGHTDWAQLIAGKRAASLAAGGVIWPVAQAQAQPPAPAGARRRHFAFDLRGLAQDCADCFMAILCRSRLARARVARA
jgi:hypothetical protein